MLIELTKGCNKIKELTELITKKLTNVKVTAKLNDEEVVYVTGMDAVTTLDEVRQVIHTCLGNQADYTLQPLREGYADTRRTE